MSDRFNEGILVYYFNEWTGPKKQNFSRKKAIIFN
jgi:hypothetical protein